MDATGSNPAPADREKEAEGAAPEAAEAPADKAPSEHSEYDSADAESYSDNDEASKERSRNSETNEHTNSDDGSFEREEGDGQDGGSPSKKVDDDEDKKNPQYIPKRGTFYEHDDRTLEDTEEVEEEEVEKDKDGKKKVWQDKKEKWDHDRFNEPEQAPKSRAELVAIYGYDIRNEEGPPRARRRRKYGRGPNKYTRKWEDEDAYNKPPVPTVKKGKKPNSRKIEEFPPLVRTSDSEQTYEPKNSSQDDDPPQQHQQNNRNEYSKNDYARERTSKAENTFNNSKNDENRRAGTGRVSNSKREPNESEYHGFTTTSRKVRNTKYASQNAPSSHKNASKDDYIHSQNFSNKNNQDLESDMNKLSINEGSKSYNKSGYNSSNSGGQRQNSVPPRLQSEPKGPKRYSSMRQKSLPETNTPPISNYQHSPTFYPTEYNQQSVPASTQQPHIHQNQMLPSTTQVAHVAPLQPAALAPVPATFAAQPYPPPPAAFMQPPAVAGPPFIPPPQSTQLLNFVQGQPAFQPNFPGFQQSFNSVTQPAELYQPQGGITYYSTDQQLAQRQVPLKRPKAAIPIVAPPAYDKKDEANPQIDGAEAVDVQQ
ncbi:unnamed protein product [Phyllotreta striolata]|uniref:Protein CASC3 n=1 Tax=Phyllotreta striolata TaxID=444603 RepID=A0A9N9XS13_PHYSR|nr:unnamed protein product [Phyllotreta striolata]